MPFFSILVPVYNKEKIVNICIDSLKKQKFSEYEVIFVNDGSTDNSLEVLNAYKEEDDRVKVISYKENKSLINARYEAMKVASGKYVLFLDSDDAFKDNALETLYEILSKKTCDVLRFAAIIESDNRILGPVESDDVLRDLFLDKIIPNIWKNCYSIDVIKKSVEHITPFYCNMGEDSFFSAIFFTYAKNIECTNEVIYIYNLQLGMCFDDSNINFEKYKKEIDLALINISKIHEFIEKNNKEYYDFIKDNSYRMLVSIASKYIYYEKDWKKIYEYLEYMKSVEKSGKAFEHLCDDIIPNKRIFKQNSN